MPKTTIRLEKAEMILLYSILLVSVINVSCQELSTTPKVGDEQLLQQSSWAVTIDDITDLRDKINQQNTLIENQNVRLAQQYTTLAQELTRFAVQNAKISDQNIKLAEQDIKILEQNTKIKDLGLKIKELEKKGNQTLQPPSNNSASKGSGSVFTRWGRRDCPRNVSQLVYSGITGGSYITHTGGAAEYVCLPPDPTWNVNKHFNGQYWGYMYGSEYENIPKAIGNYKPPCAVCRTSQFSTVLMIPARTECYQGWQKAYHGELVSGYYNHPAASQYVCVDDNPQINGINTNNEGKLMYPVRAKCGSLPCPPYEDNTLLTCVVCLK